jgi:hypothetical protein
MKRKRKKKEKKREKKKRSGVVGVRQVCFLFSHDHPIHVVSQFAELASCVT